MLAKEAPRIISFPSRCVSPQVGACCVLALDLFLVYVQSGSLVDIGSLHQPRQPLPHQTASFAVFSFHRVLCPYNRGSQSVGLKPLEGANKSFSQRSSDHQKAEVMTHNSSKGLRSSNKTIMVGGHHPQELHCSLESAAILAEISASPTPSPCSNCPVKPALPVVMAGRAANLNLLNDLH